MGDTNIFESGNCDKVEMNHGGSENLSKDLLGVGLFEEVSLSKMLTPRTIPFRSASFSQVDINPDGKYVRSPLPNSSITLKPMAYCFKKSVSVSQPSQSEPSHSKNFSPIGDSGKNFPSEKSSSENIIISTPENKEAKKLANLSAEKQNPQIEIGNQQIENNENEAQKLANYDIYSENKKPQIEIGNQQIENEEKEVDKLANFDTYLENKNPQHEIGSQQLENKEKEAENISNFHIESENSLNSDPQILIDSVFLDQESKEINPQLIVEEIISVDSLQKEIENLGKTLEEIEVFTDNFFSEPILQKENLDNCMLISGEDHKLVNDFERIDLLVDSPALPNENDQDLINELESDPSEEKENEKNMLIENKELKESDSIKEDLTHENKQIVIESELKNELSDEVIEGHSSSINDIFLDVNSQTKDSEKVSFVLGGDDEPLVLNRIKNESIKNKNEAQVEEKNNKIERQSSGQSDGSDELQPPICSSPPLSTSINNEQSGGLKKELSLGRTHSINSSLRSLPSSGRFYKKPLRGPYGQMLEAEMNKLIPSRASEPQFNEHELYSRISKSSSPSRSTEEMDEVNSSTNKINSEAYSANSKLFNSLLMASMDDLNLQPRFHPNSPRTRKISANLPMSSSTYSDNSVPHAFHQRTVSSPSQLLREETIIRRNLDGSPRGHVLAELVETEKSYVDSLRILVKNYMEPLKSSDFIDAALVDEIFFQIPTILWHHERLLESLQKRVCDDMQCVGDVLLDTCYLLFVNNWKNAKGSLKMAVASKPSLSRFLESNARQHKGKLTLDSLLIMPVQRIPRYELLVKELIKYTQPVHEDHSRLTLVLKKIKNFADSIDCASVDRNDNREIEIEGWTAGLGHLVRQDKFQVSMNSSSVRKERALFLFADSLVVASIKRKSNRKPSSNSSSQFGPNWEGCKFKLLIKVPLTDIKLLNEEMSAKIEAGSCSTPTPGPSSSKSSQNSSDDSSDDVRTLHKIMDLASTLKCPHLNLDEVLKDMLSSTKHHSAHDNGEILELEFKYADSNECAEVLKIIFGSAEKKNAWLESFHDTLGKYVRYGFGRLPHVQFVQALPIRKTRAGLQLSCAAPVSIHSNKLAKGEVQLSDVWVANSDGYVGQVCILTLHPEPSITSCNGVCNSRITCIQAVPPPEYSSPTPSSSTSTSTTLAPHDRDQNSSVEPGVSPPNPTLSPTSFSAPPLLSPAHEASGGESDESSYKNRTSQKEHWSVWLGTEDGGLHIYDCADSVRVKKNRHKIQHKAPLNCIVYFDSRVFVALGNGDVAVYSRNTKDGKGGWGTGEASWVTIGSAIAPVTKMLCVGTHIWCACGPTVKVYGDSSGLLDLVETVQITIEGNTLPRAITTMVSTYEYVWMAIQGSSILKCYNYTNFECVFETNVAPNVAKILAGCDDIIRQHKSACLRITALFVAPNNSLWIGTSAGVILTLSPSTSFDSKIVPLCHGHTGQVRFLTCVLSRESCTVISGGDGYEEFRPLTPQFNNNSSSSFSSIVTSIMGDSSGDPSGREDSTNHLLIWKTPKPT